MSTERGMGPEGQGRMRVGWEFERKTGKKSREKSRWVLGIG